jgi:bacillopeptidase F (M6 metalloprotease family)
MSDNKDVKAKELGAVKKLKLKGTNGEVKVIYLKKPSIDHLSQVHSIAQKQNAFDAQRFLLRELTIKEVSDDISNDAEFINGAIKQMDVFINPIEGELEDL